MRVEGVTFVEDAVKSMSKEEFIKRHKNVFWLCRDEHDREKMLSDTYDLIVGKKKKENK